MITLGMDPHPSSHTVAALDSNGSLLGSIKVPNTSAALEQLHQFASQFASRRWAIEGAGVVGALFLIEQIWVAGDSATKDPGKFFGICSAIGLIAGLTLNRVFPKLIQVDVPTEVRLPEKPGQPLPRRRH